MPKKKSLQKRVKPEDFSLSFDPDIILKELSQKRYKNGKQKPLSPKDDLFRPLVLASLTMAFFYL